VVVAFAAVLGFVVAVPTMASADPVNDLLNKIGVGSGSGTTGSTDTSGSTTTKAGNPPTYTPPLHGTNPHGEGNTAVVDISPSTTDPLSGDPSKTGEELVVVGDARGDASSGSGGYSGSSTLLYLLGTPIVQVQSQPGESNDGPLQPLQTQLLDQICSSSGDQLCLTVLGMHSTTTSNSSTNSFEALGAHIGGPSGINADVAQNNGNISDDGSCQTAHGDSNAASVSIGGQPVADALQGTSDSTACNGGSQSASNSSNVLKLGGQGLPIPAGGCADGTPNTNFTPLAPLLGAVCNADDTNGSQTGSPYGVREALTLFALISGDSSLLKVGTAGPETHAVAPGGPTTTTGGPTGPTGGTQGAGGKGGNQGGNGAGNGGGAGAGNGAAANNAAAGNGQLAFTGADLLALGLVGSALILGGLALTTAGRRHRQTV
jgi:hypothetical protein